MSENNTPNRNDQADDPTPFDQLIAAAGHSSTDVAFTTAFRGYDKDEVDAAIAGLAARVRAESLQVAQLTDREHRAGVQRRKAETRMQAEVADAQNEAREAVAAPRNRARRRAGEGDGCREPAARTGRRARRRPRGGAEPAQVRRGAPGRRRPGGRAAAQRDRPGRPAAHRRARRDREPPQGGAGRGRGDHLPCAARRPAGAPAHRDRAHRPSGPHRARSRARRREGRAGRARGRRDPHRGREGRGRAAVDGRPRDRAGSRGCRRRGARAARAGTRVRGVAHPPPGRRAAGVPRAAQPGRRPRRADHAGRQRAGDRVARARAARGVEGRGLRAPHARAGSADRGRREPARPRAARSGAGQSAEDHRHGQHPLAVGAARRGGPHASAALAAAAAHELHGRGERPHPPRDRVRCIRCGIRRAGASEELQRVDG